MENFEIASYLLGLISGAFISGMLILVIYLLFIKKDETSSEIQLNDLMKILVGDDEEGYLKQIKQMTERQATLVIKNSKFNSI